jgi:hypothetical protein
MVRSSLFNVASRTQSLHDRLRDEDDLPEWVQSKVASILDDVHEIEDHLGYKLHRQETDLREGYNLAEEDVEKILTDRADMYHQDKMLSGMGPSAIRELLYDDLLENIPGTYNPADYEKLIDQLSLGTTR